MKTKLILTIFISLFAATSNAVILWAGGEDIDFPNGTAINNTVGNRTGYGRLSVVPATSGLSYSTSFPSGPVTSLWLSARAEIGGGLSGFLNKFVGLSRQGTSSIIMIGSSSTTDVYKVAIWKYDGTTWTALASEPGASFGITIPHKFDIQIINYGAGGTVNVFIDGQASPIVSYTGNLLAGAATDLNRVVIGRNTTGSFYASYSEFIVSDSDTRAMSLVTLAPNAAGDLNQWTGAYTDIDENTLNDADNVSNTTSGNNFQCNLSALPSTGFSVAGVKVAARALTSGGGVSSIAIGVKTNSTISVPAATAQSAVWATSETYYQTNPVTSAVWTPAEINALQINLQTAP